MRLGIRAFIIVLTIFVAGNLAIGQTQPNPKKKATNPPKQVSSASRDREILLETTA